jgi:hypothetical protein
MFIAITVVTLALVAANAAVTFLVAKADWYTPKQKLAQSCVVWCVPAVGAALIALVLFSNRERTALQSNHAPEIRDNAEYALPSSHGGHDP